MASESLISLFWYQRIFSIPFRILVPLLCFAAFLWLPDSSFVWLTEHESSPLSTFQKWTISFLDISKMKHLLCQHLENELLFFFQTSCHYFKISRHNYSYFHHKTICSLFYIYSMFACFTRLWYKKIKNNASTWLIQKTIKLFILGVQFRV